MPHARGPARSDVRQPPQSGACVVTVPVAPVIGYTSALGVLEPVIWLLEVRCPYCSHVHIHGGGVDRALVADYLGGRWVALDSMPSARRAVLEALSTGELVSTAGCARAAGLDGTARAPGSLGSRSR